MTPLGCEGGVQCTTAVVSDVPTTPIISTTPGAVEKSNCKIGGSSLH